MTKFNEIKRAVLSAGTALNVIVITGGIAAMVMPISAAQAQDYNQVNATGRVTGTNGKAIAGAKVSVKSNGQGFERTVQTDSNGSYRVQSLPQGSYTFTVEANGFDTFTDDNVQLTQAGAANQFALLPAGGGGEIVVTAGRLAVPDFDRNTTGAVINVSEIASRVPLARDITSVTLLSPGVVSGGATGTFGNLPSINGSSVSENVYYVNGLNTTQFRNGLGAVTVPFDFYQSVEVKNGGIAAEFGRTTGGVINATTKSGTNQYHGSVTFNWEPNSLRSKAPNVFNRDNDSRFDERREFIAELSGPIIKDHLFVYGIYSARDVNSGGGFTGTSSTTSAGATACTTNPTMCTDFGNLRAANLTLAGTQFRRDQARDPFYGVKVDAVITDGQRLEGTYWNSSNTTTRDVYGTSLFSLASGQRYNPNTNNPGGYAARTVFKEGGENYVLRYTGTFTDWLTVSAAYGKNKNKDNTETSTPNLPAIIDQRNGANTNIGNPTSNKQQQLDTREFFRGDVDLNFNFVGSHHVRFGYDRENLAEDSTTSANGGYQYTLATAGFPATTGTDPITGLPNGTNYAIQRTFVNGGKFQTRNEAYYIQDSWKLLEDRLQLNLGLRNDKFVNRNGVGQAFYKSGDQWGPRLGFSFDPSGDRRTKVYGSFSRYFLPIAANTNVRLTGGELDYDAYYRLTGLNADNTPILGAPVTTGAGFVTCLPGGPAGTSCIIRNNGSPQATDVQVASNLKPQSTDEFILGAEHRFGSHWKVGAFFTYTKLNDSLEDAAIDQAVVPYCVSQGNTEAACRGIWSGLHQYVLINPGRDVAITLNELLPNQAANASPKTVLLSAASLGYDKARRTYTALTLTVDREFDGKWGLSASYTYSKLRGNIEGGVRTDNSQTDSGLTTAFDLPALVDGTYGDLPNDRRHNFKIYGTYKVNDWLMLGANAQVTSPRHFGCLGRVPALRDGNATQTGGLAGPNYGAAGFYCNVDASGNVITNPTTFTAVNPSFGTAGTPSLVLTPRGSKFASNWFSVFNVDATIKVPTTLFDASLRVSVFNVFNQHNATEYVEVGTSTTGQPNATYGLPTIYQQPRTVRLQLKVGF